MQDIIVVDSIDTVIDEYRITALRSAVINFLKENEYRIIHTRIDHRLSKLNAFLLKNNYVLYISKLSEIRESDGFVICIESSPSLLSRHEIDTLNNCINLLKARLFY
ncbi:hypothetical protein OAP56_00850 [Rickettsiaceae bacterium]|nr:hypothetical protein [Rickettsiaceae bacterium]